VSSGGNLESAAPGTWLNIHLQKNKGQMTVGELLNPIFRRTDKE